jgi:hypothetical protein
MAPAGPRAKEQIADHLANWRVRALIAGSQGQPGQHRVRRVRLDPDRERDGRVQVQRGPDARQRADKRFDCYPEGSVILTQLGVIGNLSAAREQ